MKRPASFFVAWFAVVVVVAALAACTDRSQTVSGINAAPGGTSGDPTVTSTDPNNAPQDTTLDVVVSGSGFDRGSQAQWALAGVPYAKIRTNSTRFLSSKQLIANITIALDADTVLYDVIVTTSTGKKGIGTELFKVRAKGPPSPVPAITVTFDNRIGDNITSDGRGSYVDGECGVTATFSLTDARLDPDANKVRPHEATACDGRAARKVIVAFTQPVEGSPPGNTVGATFFKVNEVELVTVADGTVLRTAIAIPQGACTVRFNPNLDPQSSYVTVTKNADGTWTVATQAFPNDVAVCLPDESQPNPPPRSYYHMPFQVTIRLK